MNGYRALILERDIHPRDHVGESITPSTNPIFKQIGFLEKIEDAGFVHKPGACWTAPSAPPGKFVSLRLGEFPPPDAPQLYTYNVERDEFDTLLLRHAHDKGASVLQGVNVQRVLFEEDRAVGVRARVADGWERDLHARTVVDASGRRCMIANQLKLKRKDPVFNQFGIYSWFRGVEPNPPGFEGFLFLHFLGLERCWAWQIPMRDGVCSVGVVTDKADFQKSGRSHEAFFESLVRRNRSLEHNMRNAERIRPWWIEGDYSYIVDQLAGPGWLLIGDALRFVDPIFSTGVDVAAYSALYAFETINAVHKGEDEGRVFKEYEKRVGDGVEAWYDLIALFYRLQNLFTIYAVKKRFREKVVRILQGNLYMPETLERAREIIRIMEESYERVMDDPGNLLRPGALAAARAARLDGSWSSSNGVRDARRPLSRALAGLTPEGDSAADGEALRTAAEEAASAIVEQAGEGARAVVAGARYEVREITWPVEPSSGVGGAFACPHPTLTLLRDDAVLLDVRTDYWDGSTSYTVAGEKMGRWSRFRMGSPGERGYDLHLATAEELAAFARDVSDLVRELGVSG
jgi:1H-pyrrole-2-carbonyl-[peptidyl-carrier protein] chlorinase